MLSAYHDTNHIPIDCHIKMSKSSSITNSTIMYHWQQMICDLLTIVIVYILFACVFFTVISMHRIG